MLTLAAGRKKASRCLWTTLMAQFNTPAEEFLLFLPDSETRLEEWPDQSECSEGKLTLKLNETSDLTWHSSSHLLPPLLLCSAFFCKEIPGFLAIYWRQNLFIYDMKYEIIYFLQKIWQCFVKITYKLWLDFQRTSPGSLEVCPLVLASVLCLIVHSIGRALITAISTIIN